LLGGPIDRAVFGTDVERVPPSDLCAGDVVVMGDLSGHKGAGAGHLDLPLLWRGTAGCGRA